MTKKAFDKIAAGLHDALALAEGGAVYALAEAWASIDGKVDDFRRERGLDPVNSLMTDPNFTGHYVGYMEEAEEMIRRLQRRGFTVVPLTPVGTVLTPAPTGTHDISGHFEDKWFVHSFIATYADTNSVGNVYFGMYAMWVGKTRELFFNRVMPKFNLKETPFYILTRSFDHKFVRETKEFETVSVKIRVAGHNRKFVTLEHEIYDSVGNLLGKGSQSLLFVSSSDYKMIDIPSDVMGSFLAYL